MIKEKIRHYKPNWRRLALELLVVFLGVSSGFILNNKREDFKDKKLEYLYIESFIRNIDTNIVGLQENIKNDTVWKKKTEKTIALIHANKYPVDSTSVLINSILEASKVSLVTSTYEDIKSSGNFNIIRDFTIKEKIISYHSSIDGVKYVDEYYNSFFQDFSLPFLLEKYNIVKDEFLRNKVESRYELYNIVMGNFSIRTQRTQTIIDLLESSEQLKKDLQAYIQNEF